MRQRHLGTIRSNLDGGWEPSSFSNNQQLKFDDYKFHDNNPKTALDDFYSYSGTLNTFNNPKKPNQKDPAKSKIVSWEEAQKEKEKNFFSDAQQRFGEMQGWQDLIDQGYAMNPEETKYYNDTFGQYRGVSAEGAKQEANNANSLANAYRYKASYTPPRAPKNFLRMETKPGFMGPQTTLTKRPIF